MEEAIRIVIGLIGGLGLFLYGMTIMGDGLQKSAGNKLKKIIEILTTNKMIGMLVGAVVTMIIQSSSATTVMVIGFVNAGIMSLIQAAGVIMGANIGTTVTAQIVALDLSALAPAVIGIGVAMWLFAKNKRSKNIAEIFIGFGILFLGMELMQNSLRPLRSMPIFEEFIMSIDVSSPLVYLLAIGVGFLFTAIIQSSSATTGILVAMAFEGLITIEIALPIIFGTNIGTCITALLSSIGANTTAKRAAAIHMLFNIIGTLIFVIFFRDITLLVATTISPINTARQIANAHTFFNITNTLLLLPFSKYIVMLAEKIIPEKADGKREFKTYLDERMLGTPGIALVQVTKEIISMAEIALESYNLSVQSIIEKLPTDLVFELEKVINQKHRNIESYLVKLNDQNVSSQQHEKMNLMISLISDIERIGDHAENVAELSDYVAENSIKFSDLAIAELKDMHGKVQESVQQSIEAMETNNIEIAESIVTREDKIDELERKLRKSHIDRLNKGQCTVGAGVIFLDILTNLERIADHTEKIAYYVMDTVK